MNFKINRTVNGDCDEIVVSGMDVFHHFTSG